MPIRSLRRAVFGAFAALFLAGAVLAHDVTPSAIHLRPGAQDFVYVFDPTGCKATITAKSTVPGSVMVYAVNMTTGAVIPGSGVSATVPGRQDQVFVVRASTSFTGAVSGAIEVCWVGEDWPSTPCNENNCAPYAPHSVAVLVEDHPSSIGHGRFSAILGDPIATDDGEVFLGEAADLDLGGPMPLAFQRGYSSRWGSDGTDPGALGPSWRHAFDWRLAATGHNLEITTPRGRVIRFERGYFATAWTLALYDDVPFQLVDTGPERRLADPTTGEVRTFDASGRLTKIEDGHGNVHTLSYNGASLDQVSDGLGRALSFTHGAGGELTSVSDGTRSVAFTYAGGVLASATDADGGVTQYAYDPAFPGQALMVARTLPEGNTPYTHAYDAQERAIQETSARGHSTSLAYGTGGTTTVTDPLSNDQVHTHGAGGKLTGLEDEGGSASAMQYDAQDRRRAVTDRLGKTSSWTYHVPSGLPASLTESDGTLTGFGYTARAWNGLSFYDLTSIVHPGGATESFQHDANGNLTQATDLAGGLWTYTYNGQGQVLSATDPEGGVTSFTYNGDGTLATHEDAAGRVTAFAYDALRRLEEVALPDGSSRLLTYDALDRILSITDEMARTTGFVYDRNGNLLSLVDPTGESWTLTYDLLDRPTGILDPQGGQAAFTWDARGKLASLVDGAGTTASFGYDARGRLASIADGLGQVWSHGSDLEGVSSSLTDPGLHAATFASDARGRITKATTPLGHATAYAYDARSHLKSITAPGGSVTSFTYDPLGLVAGSTLPGSGGTAGVERDGLGSPVEITYPGGRAWQFGRDATGLMASRIDPLGRAATASRDARGRVVDFDYPGGLGSATLTWNAASQLTDIDHSDGTSQHFDYDAAGRITNADGAALTWDRSGRIASSNGMAIGRDGAGRITSVTLAPGKVVTYAYDPSGALASVTDWVGGTTIFTYDEAGRRVELARPNGVTTRTTYDDASRPIQIEEVQIVEQGEVELSATNVEWSVHDLITELDSTPLILALPALGKTQRSFDAAGQVVGWSHDAMGRVLDDGTSTFGWDLAGRMRSHASGGVTTGLDYDGFDQAIVATGSFDAEFGRNYALGGVISIVTTSGQPETYYVHDPDGKLLHAVDDATGERRFYHFELGSTSFLTDESAAITDVYELDPFGRSLGQSGTTPNPFVFLGERGAWRVGTGDLYLVGGRPYDAAAALYLTPALSRPVDPGEGNPYLFGASNPLPRREVSHPIPRFADPTSGLDSLRTSVCRTNLLFPFITNLSGFDTGIAVANITSDTFQAGASGSTQRGACYLGDDRFYGRWQASSPAGLSSAPSSSVGPVSRASVFARGALQPAHSLAFGQTLTHPFTQRFREDFATVPFRAPGAVPEANHRETIAKFRRIHPVVGRRVRTGNVRSLGTAAVLVGDLYPTASPIFTVLGTPDFLGGSSPNLFVPSFISDLGTQRLASGYLALVMDDTLGQRQAALGEQVGH